MATLYGSPLRPDADPHLAKERECAFALLRSLPQQTFYAFALLRNGADAQTATLFRARTRIRYAAEGTESVFRLL
jgi:hypothetical protein